MLQKLEELETECHVLKGQNEEYSAIMRRMEEQIDALEKEKQQRGMKQIDPEDELNGLHTISSLEG